MKPGMWQGLALLLVGGFFLVAGGSKIPNPQAFQESIEAYRLVGGWPARWAALYLPMLEVVAALALCRVNWRLAGAWVLAGMLVVFQVALASALWRGLDLDCGCVGEGGSSSVLVAFVRNWILLGLLASGFFPTFAK